MRETTNIFYKSVIVHENNEKVTDKYEGEAVHEMTFTSESYTFNHKTFGKMAILLEGNQVTLSYGNTKMKMTYEMHQKILYNTLYGQIPLEVYLKKLNRTNQSISIVYYLYDGSTILSKCYLTLEKNNSMIS